MAPHPGHHQAGERKAPTNPPAKPPERGQPNGKAMAWATTKSALQPCQRGRMLALPTIRPGPPRGRPPQSATAQPPPAQPWASPSHPAPGCNRPNFWESTKAAGTPPPVADHRAGSAGAGSSSKGVTEHPRANPDRWRVVSQNANKPRGLALNTPQKTRLLPPPKAGFCHVRMLACVVALALVLGGARLSVRLAAWRFPCVQRPTHPHR